MSDPRLRIGLLVCAVYLVAAMARTGAAINTSFATGFNAPYSLALQAVPEPQVHVLLAAGALLLCLRRRRT